MEKWRQGCVVALLLLGQSLGALGAPQAHSKIAAILAAGNAKQAEQLADGALADNGLSPSDNAVLLVDRGMAREAQDRHDDALVDITRAIDMRALPRADQAHALFVRGAILDGLGRSDDAIGDYSAALVLAPRYAPALNNRANAYRRQSRFMEAKRDYLASLSAGNLQPEYSYYGLGQIAEAAGNPQSARGFYAQAVAANPNYGLAADRLAALGADGLVLQADAPIHLHQPKSASSADADDAPLVLRPPAAASLHPPARIVPASYGRSEAAEPGLRPALDATGKGAQIQLGAWRTEQEAGQGWNKALQHSAGLLNGMSPHIVAVDLPGRGRYYRLRAGPAAENPAKLCVALQAQGLDCIPARD